MLRVGFAVYGTAEWAAITQVYRNLWKAVEQSGAAVQPVALVPPDFDLAGLEGKPDSVEVRRSQWLTMRTPAWALRVALREALRHDVVLEQVLKRNGIDVLSHSGSLGRRAQVPAVGWIPDFQHVRLPEFSPPRERALRDRGFARTCRESTLVIVSSEDARGDLAAFAPADAHKARVLRFVADPLPQSELPSLETLRAEHGFDGPYLHLPNQLWRHKNHAVVVEALARLRDDDHDLLVLATGPTRDYRWPDHADNLRARIKELDLEDRFRILGKLPFPHVAGLMRHAVAVVNPSLFEGWSTTVEESKSTGKRVVLSDLPVHREQDPPDAIYFDPHDAGACAQSLLRAWTEHDATQDAARQVRAASELPQRRREYGERYAAILAEAVGTSRGH